MRQVKPVAGPGAGDTDYTLEIIVAGRAGYFLVTGRDVDEEGYVTHFLPPDEFRAARMSACMSKHFVQTDTEYDARFQVCAQEGREIGFKHRVNGEIHLFMDLGQSPAQVLGTYFHELGHALQDALAPEQTEAQGGVLIDALLEAEAQIFEAAAWRSIEDYLGRPLTAYPDLPIVSQSLDARLNSRVTGDSEHDLGYRLLWVEALTDTGNNGLAQDLRADGVLSAGGAWSLFNFLVSMDPVTAVDWAADMIGDAGTVNEYLEIAATRTVSGLDPADFGHPDLQDPAWAAP